MQDANIYRLEQLLGAWVAWHELLFEVESFNALLSDTVKNAGTVVCGEHLSLDMAGIYKVREVIAAAMVRVYEEEGRSKL